MTLRKRTLLAVGGVLAALVTGLLLVSSVMLLGGFRALDEERSRRELHRVLQSMNASLASLRSIGGDWGYWDETYRFAAGDEPDYVSRNLADESLVNMALNLFAITDGRGRVLYAAGFDQNTGKRVAVPADVDSLLRSMRPNLPDAVPADSRAGAYCLREGALLLATAPILQSSLEGPCRGTLVAGRWFDPSQGTSDDYEQPKVSLCPATAWNIVAGGWAPLSASVVSTALPAAPDGAARRASIASCAERVVPAGGHERVVAEGLLWDFPGTGRLLLRADLPGQAYAQGRRAVQLLLITFLGIGGLFGIVILLLLERGVLSRIGRLHREVTGIARDRDFERGLTITGHDEISGLTAAVEDLRGTLATSLREKESALHDLQRAKAVAEDLARARSRFLSTMSHEIRTPMGAILGMTGLLLDTDLTTEQREHILILQSGAENLLHILDDILDLSKVEEGKMVLEETAFDLRETVEDVAGLLAWNAAKKGLELIADVDPTLPAQVRGDPVRVRQILANLVGNAVKFTGNGEIVIKAVAEETPGAPPVLHFSVLDTGVGIAPDRLEAVFDEFTQEDQSTARRFGGTGLGLTICRRLADLMQGRLTVESVIGKGSTFHFTLPLRPAEQGRSDGPALQGPHVLLVDDSASSRGAVAALLRSLGGQVLEAGSAADALAIVDSRPYEIDTFLVDRHLGDRDGLELAAEIRRRMPTGAGTRIHLLCRPGEAPRELDVPQLGVTGVIAKPVRRSRLFTALERPQGAGGEAETGRTSTAEAPASAPRDPIVSRIGDPSISPGAPVGGDFATSIPADLPSDARILIVDDNAVNRRVVRRMIEKAGGRAEEATGGEEGVRLWREKPFDLVLMDIQMPGMDGYQATAAIRAEDAARGTHTPIVALTANVLPEDRELCLASGMDEHLGKPVRAPDLVRTLSTWLKPAKERPNMDNHLPALPLQLERLDEVSGGDTEFELELIDEFLRTAPVLLEDASKAVAAGDSNGAQRAAHTLKGASGSIGAGPLCEASRMLEETCKQGRLNEAAPRVDLIRERLMDLSAFVAEHYSERAA